MGIQIQVSPTFDIRHTALFLAGLREHGPLRIVLDPAVRNEVVLWCTRNERKVVIDLSDHADHFDEAGLAWCDVYLKRNLTTTCGKVQPFGLNYSGRDTWAALQAAFARRDLRAAVDLMRRAHGREYEYAPEKRKDKVVLLQTRLWEADECPGDLQINEQRIELVASLARAFGTRFQGGLVDTPLARRMAPSLISKNYKQREYIAWQKTAQVAVYTRGLYGSLAYKMAEYLASSKCIVSEPIDVCLPTPLADGKHVRWFSTHAECVARCGELLEQPGEFPRNTWNYYQQHVRLAADAVRQVLEATTRAQ